MMGNAYVESEKLLSRAKRVLAGGVSSEFRKYNHPHALFYTHGIGSRIYDADGNEYLDFTLSQGPLILGHSHPAVLSAVEEYSRKGQLFAGQHIREIELAEKINSLVPSCELMRFCLDGSEAVQTALRVARAKTGKPRFLRFEGHYHGWLDNVAWGISAPSIESLGSRENPVAQPWTQGIARNAEQEFIIIPWNDQDLLQDTLEKHHHELAALIMEPVMCNNGCIEPGAGFLTSAKTLCERYNIALIFDEVITGFRLGLSGAQGYFGIEPDISVFAKAMGSGYPISVVGGKREWMELVASGSVIQAGTMNSGNATVAAALATLNVLQTEQPYERMFSLGSELMHGLRDIAKRSSLDLQVQGPGPIFHTAFGSSNKIKDYRDTLSLDKEMLRAFISGMHDNGIRIIGRGLWYISAAHTQSDIRKTLEKAEIVLKNLKN